ncbi:MAG: GNAT family N-acetyltransferase [Pseudomonadota bacterium]
MASVTIRRLGSADIALHRRVLALYGRAFEEPETYPPDGPSQDYLEALLARPDFIELAALDGDAAVGALSAYVLPKFEAECSEVFIFDLAVDASHRRRGIATALIEAVKPHARAASAKVIFVMAQKGDGPATALYESLAAREEVLSFDIDPHR